jgi:hypothetical protein
LVCKWSSGWLIIGNIFKECLDVFECCKMMSFMYLIYAVVMEMV